MNRSVHKLKSEVCYHVEIDSKSEKEFGAEKMGILEWILKQPQQVGRLPRTSQWGDVRASENEVLIEIGPRSVS